MNRIQPLSVLLDLALAGICSLTMAPSAPRAAPLRIEFVPHPRDMVEVKEGVPYVVPLERIFVVTALGSLAQSSAQLMVNNTMVLQTFYLSSDHLVMSSVPLGLKVPAGSTITVTDSAPGSDGRVWGFLTNL